MARTGASPGQGAARETRGRKRPRKRRARRPCPAHQPGAGRQRGAAAGCGGLRRPPSPLPRLRRKRLGFERCRRRPPPAKLQRAEPAPAAAPLTSYPNSSTDRRGLPLSAPSLPAPATPAHPRPSVPRVGIRCGPWPRGLWAPGRGGGGVALPPRPRPGSRLRLPPRKAGAAASSSFRFPLAPSLGRSVLRENQRPLRAPPHAPPGQTTARLLPRGRETPGSPLPPRPRGALSPPRRAPLAARERAAGGPRASPSQVFLLTARARLAPPAAVLQFPGFSRPPTPTPLP